MNDPRTLLEPVSPRRLGDQVYARLIEAIATNQIAEGAKIQEDTLVEQLGVSKTPIREALRRLQAEGFLVADAHRTPEVRRLQRADVVEFYDLREYLERLAARRAAERHDEVSIDALASIQTSAEQRFAAGGVPIEYSVDYNRQFHGLVLQGAGNGRLRRMYELISVDIRRLAYRSIRGEGRQRVAIEQHRAILDAIDAKDADLAEDLMTRHIRRGRADVLAQFQERGDDSNATASMSGTV